MSGSHSLIDAIHNKYDDTGDIDGILLSGNIKIYVPKSGPVSSPSGQLRLPRRLTLDSNGINRAGDDTEIKQLCSTVEELDLTKNNISDWREVLKILCSIPHLHFLNLTLNPLDDATVPDSLMDTFPCMQDLVLNNTNVSWRTVAKLLSVFPSLKVLHLSLNGYTTIDLPPDIRHNHVTSVYLNDCNISQWEELQKLGHALPSLESLNLIHTNISSLPSAEEYCEFPCLKSLNVCQTQITTCETIERFGSFPSLAHLRILGVPFMKDASQKERRQMIVARLPKITQLNGSAVTDVEREESERAFIRHFLDTEHKPPRFEELVAKHGTLNPLVHIDLTPENYINLLVTFEGKSEFMDIYLHQTIWEFKTSLQAFTGLPPQDLRVFYVEKFDGADVFSDELKIGLKSRKMLSLNMNPGDELQIERRLSL